MYKSDLVDIEYDLEDIGEPSFDLDPYDWLELDLKSMALDSN